MATKQAVAREGGTAPSRTKDPLFLLTADQAAQTRFPEGCPVVYQFRARSAHHPPPSSASASASAVTDIHVGSVAAVSLDPARKRFVFRVARRRTSSGTPSAEDEVEEDDVAYALGCPVLIAVGAEEIAGEIVFVKPVEGVDGRVTSMRYIVKYALEESLWRMEEGVTAERLSFNAKGTNDNDNDEDAHNNNASHANKQVKRNAGKQDAPPPPVVVPVLSSNSTDGGDSQAESVLFLEVDRAIELGEKRTASTRLRLPPKPPPSNTLLQDKAPSKDRAPFKLEPRPLPQSDVHARPSAAEQRKAAAKLPVPRSRCGAGGVTSPLTVTDDFSECAERPAQHIAIDSRPSPKRDCATGADRRAGGREGTEGSPRKQRKQGHGAGATQGERAWAEDGKEPLCQLTVPLWVMDVPHGDIFGQLVGTNGFKMKNIRRETGCNVRLSRFNKEARQPLRITITPMDAQANVEMAISMLEQDLQNYVGEVGAAGRLRFELRAGSPFFPRAAGGALRTGGDRWLQLLELPCLARGRTGRSARGVARLDPALQESVWDSCRCAAELFADGPGAPLTRCRPYALVQGRDPRQVERATTMLTDARRDPSCA